MFLVPHTHMPGNVNPVSVRLVAVCKKMDELDNDDYYDGSINSTWSFNAKHCHHLVLVCYIYILYMCTYVIS